MSGKPHTIKNKDGKDVTYPSALYNQLVDPSNNDDFKPSSLPDIVLTFNSDVKYWFEVNISIFIRTKLTIQ
jgi:hypothetical protein